MDFYQLLLLLPCSKIAKLHFLALFMEPVLLRHFQAAADCMVKFFKVAFLRMTHLKTTLSSSHAG